MGAVLLHVDAFQACTAGTAPPELVAAPADTGGDSAAGAERGAALLSAGGGQQAGVGPGAGTGLLPDADLRHLPDVFNPNLFFQQVCVRVLCSCHNVAPFAAAMPACMHVSVFAHVRVNARVCKACVRVCMHPPCAQY